MGGQKVGKTCSGRQCGCSSGNCYYARWECKGGSRNIRAREAAPARRGKARDMIEANAFQLQEQGYRRVQLKQVRHTFDACLDGNESPE